MRRTCFTLLLSSVFALSSPAFAADAGTYRPGNTYNSITATTADICEMQCSGDAQCRSWNYVRIKNMSEGVCEFNDNIAAPQASAISVSGNNVSRARPSRVSSGGTNTVRVGSPAVTQAASRATPTHHVKARAQARPTQPSPASSQYAGLSLMEQQRLYSQNRGQAQKQPARPISPRINPRQLRHSLEEGRTPQSPPTQMAVAPRQSLPQSAQGTAPRQMANAPVAPAYGDPRLQRRLMQQRQNVQPGHTPAQKAPQTYPPIAPTAAPREFAAASGGLSSPPGVAPLTAPPGVPPLPQQGQVQAPSAYMSPSMAGAPPAQPQRRVSIPSELSPRPMGTGDQLFGSLYDDVKAPRPLEPSLTADPDAPIPTVSSVPVAPVQTAPLPPVR